jgi:hypothetical protein
VTFRSAAIVPALAGMALLTSSIAGGSQSQALAAGCTGVQIRAGSNIAAIVNNHPGKAPTTFCLAAGTFRVSSTLKLSSGDKLVGPTGSVATRGPATYGVPRAKIIGPATLPVVIQLDGPNTRVAWVDVSGGDSAIGAGKAGPTAVLTYLAIHGTRRSGIASMNGTLSHSNLYNNSVTPSFWGYNAAAVKGTDEYQAEYNYVHNNLANGIWCDVGCAPKASLPHGYWVRDNLVVNNGRWGVRYENSPLVSSGVHQASPTALIENNSIHGNGYNSGGAFGGASMFDAQNGVFRDNSFGAATVAGVTYRANTRSRAIYFHSSGKASRPDLWNAHAVNNLLHGETITGCGGVVACTGNG